MLNKYRYENLIKTFQFHYSQFNIWMAFFIIISGGLFAAYYSNGFNSFNEKILILLFGYIVSFLFHCCAKSYRFCVINFSKLIYDHEERNVQCDYDRVYSCLIEPDNHYYHPLKGVNMSISKIIALFSFLLTYAWGLLLISNILNKIEKNYLMPFFCKCEIICVTSLLLYNAIKLIISIALITIINVFFLWLAKKMFLCEYKENYFLLKPKSIIRQEKNTDV